jgi:hypothetical protein
MIGLVLCAGCYDGKALIEDARSQALRTRLVEVDLGSYCTAMPREPQTSETAELSLHIFGTVPRYRVPEIEKQLEADGYRLRHETLAAVRHATPVELAEPSFDRLRARIEEVVNQNLKEAPVKSIGFYEVRLRRR